VKAVGVKQLKARLSEYVRLVRAGETLLVTDRDEVVAEMRPARRATTAAGPEEALEMLEEKGDVQRCAHPKVGWRWSPKGLALPAGTARRLLDELRSETDGR
jgi:antitoxin (DNA-binding transcriptional repressor) of toxin-antitoxin stability system